MKSSLLPEPLDFSKCLTYEEQEKIAYDFFKNNIRDLNVRQKYKGKEIKLRLTPPYFDGKEEAFLHLTGFNEITKYSNKPCKKIKLTGDCFTNCITDNIPINQRNLCIFRASLLPWFNVVLELANSDDSHIKYWENIRIDRRRKKENKSILIRFQEDEIDYLIVIGVFKKNNEEIYQLRSAYPLFFDLDKRKADKEYETYTISFKK